MTKETESVDEDHLYTCMVAELGLDHNGDPKWYASTRDGWNEVGTHDNTLLELSVDHFKVGSRVEIHEPIPE